MNKNTLEPLAWDSQFFGYPVARVSLDQNSGEELDDLFKQLAAGNFRLTYFFVAPGEKEMNERIIKKRGVLVDQKTVFQKPTEKHNEFSNEITEFQGTEPNARLRELALQAGTFSRFRIDKNFIKNEYKRLYLAWITRSVNKEIAFKTLVATKGSEIIGLTTLAEEKKCAHIGLVAVAETFRGQGIGRDLIRSADTIAFAMGFKEIKVVSQLQNKGACKLYEKCGFHVESITNIYHYWQ